MNNHYAVERVMDIIAYMISEGRQGAPLNAIDTATLQAQGYTDSEIAAALSWIMERQADRDEIEGQRKVPSAFFTALNAKCSNQTHGEC